MATVQISKHPQVSFSPNSPHLSNCPSAFKHFSSNKYAKFSNISFSSLFLLVVSSDSIEFVCIITLGGEKSKNAAGASQVIRNSQVVCFDVDSTVIREEGIDELAQFCGKGQEVARLTKEAMKGSMTFQEALRLRLNIIQPTQQQIREFLKSRPSTLSPGIK